jgi:hypothetical protein
MSLFVNEEYDDGPATPCAWCGLLIAYEEGGHCQTCDRHTCIDCYARLVVLDGAGGPMASAHVGHLGNACAWSVENGWLVLPAPDQPPVRALTRGPALGSIVRLKASGVIGEVVAEWPDGWIEVQVRDSGPWGGPWGAECLYRVPKSDVILWNPTRNPTER